MSEELLKEFIERALLEYSDACRYESVVIKSLKLAHASGYMKRAACNDPTRPDADIRVGDEVFYVEVKSNPRAQMGGGSVGYSLQDKKFFPTGENRELSQMIVDVLNEMNDSSLHRGLGILLRYLSKMSGKAFDTVPISGFDDDAWVEAVNSGMLLPINRTFSSDMSVIRDHYARKDTHYIQIGGEGFFRLSEANPANLPVPVLTGQVQLEVRLAKAGKPSAGIRVQARLNAKAQSPYTLDDPQSIEAMLKPRNRTKKSA